MTEEEAKTKWCPQRGRHKAENDRNKWNIDSACIGSACMAWRWHSNVEYGDLDIVEEKPPIDGYCGLAGKP